MKAAWAIVLISALTDLTIAAGGAILAADDFDRRTIIIATVTGLMALARAIQGALKNAQSEAALTGSSKLLSSRDSSGT